MSGAPDIYAWLFGARGRDAVRNPIPLLPLPLEPFAVAIAATVRPMVGASVIDGPPDKPTGSQLGGRPWWPKGSVYPRGRDGAPLFLLAQINCAELPAMAPFPREGLIQLFIGTGDHYGANFDDLRKPSGFACIYHPRLDVESDAAAVPRRRPAAGALPLETPSSPKALAFTLEQMAIDVSDYRFAALLPDIADDEALLEAYVSWLIDDVAVPAVRLGGYPTFTQEDPRAHHAGPALGDLALLTVDTTNGIMWGDSGAAQFLMHEDDLARRDFTRVIYNWDCC